MKNSLILIAAAIAFIVMSIWAAMNSETAAMLTTSVLAACSIIAAAFALNRRFLSGLTGAFCTGAETTTRCALDDDDDDHLDRDETICSIDADYVV